MNEVEFGPIFLTIIISLLGYAVVVIFEKLNQNYIPESGGWILFGLLFAVVWGLLPVYPYLIPTNDGTEYHSHLQTQLVFHEELFAKIFLPIIIFEAGWSLTGHSRTVFLHSFFQISALAVIGTIISLFITFGSIMSLSVYDLTILDYKDALVLSALIAATDPVATLSVFSKLKVHPVLNSFTFGESILNDAVAIVIFRSFMQLYHEAEGFTARTAFKIIGIMMLNAVGSVAVGVSMALIGSLILKLTNIGHRPNGSWQIIFTSLFAFLTYSIADLFLSGVVSVFFFAIFARHYLFYNLPEDAQFIISEFFIIAREFCEMLVFFLLGMQIVWYTRADYSFTLIAVVFASIIVGRFFHVTVLGYFFNLTRKEETKLNWKMQFMLAWSGLRGAVAFTLSLQTPKGFDFHNMDVTTTELPINSDYTLNCTCNSSPIDEAERIFLQREHDVHSKIVTTTLIITFITVFLFGGFTSPLLSFFGLAGDENNPTEEELQEKFLQKSEYTIKFLRFDHQYLIPFFSTEKGRDRNEFTVDEVIEFQAEEAKASADPEEYLMEERPKLQPLSNYGSISRT